LCPGTTQREKTHVAGNIRLHVGFTWIYLDFTEIDGLKNRGGGNMRLPVRISRPWRPAMMESPKYGDVNLAYFWRNKHPFTSEKG